MVDTLIVVSPDSLIRTVNPAICALLGYKEEELIGQPVGMIIAEEKLKDTRIVDLIQSGSITKVETTYLSKHGREIPVSFSGSVMSEVNGEVQGIVCAAQDITELKQQEEQLRETARLVSIGELAAGVAHEINNPLTIIVGSSEVLEREDLPPSVETQLRRIQTQADRAARIVRNLLSFARRQQTELLEVDLVSIIEKALELKAHYFELNDIHVKKEWPLGLHTVTADRHQLTQVILNILTNAEQATMESGGRGEVQVKVEVLEKCLRTSVADNGPGILSEKSLSHRPAIWFGVLLAAILEWEVPGRRLSRGSSEYSSLCARLLSSTGPWPSPEAPGHFATASAGCGSSPPGTTHSGQRPTPVS